MFFNCDDNFIFVIILLVSPPHVCYVCELLSVQAKSMHLAWTLSRTYFPSVSCLTRAFSALESPNLFLLIDVSCSKFELIFYNSKVNNFEREREWDLACTTKDNSRRWESPWALRAPLPTFYWTRGFILKRFMIKECCIGKEWWM